MADFRGLWLARIAAIPVFPGSAAGPWSLSVRQGTGMAGPGVAARGCYRRAAPPRGVIVIPVPNPPITTVLACVTPASPTQGERS
jgi:hypothetical protein